MSSPEDQAKAAENYAMAIVSSANKELGGEMLELAALSQPTNMSLLGTLLIMTSYVIWTDKASTLPQKRMLSAAAMIGLAKLMQGNMEAEEREAALAAMPEAEPDEEELASPAVEGSNSIN